MKPKRLWFLMLIVMVIGACSPKAPAVAPIQQSASPVSDGYSVSISPVDFVAVVDNPYFPLARGSRWVYETALEDGTIERIEIEVLQETRVVNGVTATVIHDVVRVDGQLVEETIDWYAQDTQGNVWYLGEAVDNYENGVLVDHAGSWEWGKDSALPGVIMWADPSAHLNDAYYQEFYAGEAEDQGQVLSASENVTVPFDSYSNVVKTYDFSSLDPDLKENKFYAKGVGLIKAVNQVTGEEEVLIEFIAGT